MNNIRNALIEAPFLYRLVVLFFCGAALAFTQAPYYLLPLLFLSFGVFYFIFSNLKTARHGFAAAFSFLFGYFLFGLHWIGNALLVEGNEFWWVWPLAVIALPCALAIIGAFHLFLIPRIFKKSGAAKFLAFCAMLALSEWMRGHIFTGFPWNLFGYSWLVVMPVAQITSVIGPYGLSFLTIFWAALAGYWATNALKQSKIMFGVMAALSLIFVFVYGISRLSTYDTKYHEDVIIQIVQPNIEQKAKWDGEKLAQNFETQIRLSKNSNQSDQKRIIIWPETAIPPIFLKNEQVNQRISDVLNKDDILLAGVLEAETLHDKVGYYNALGIWKKNQPYERLYSKSHLVPFGEYIPFQQYIPLPTITQFSGFQRGRGPQTIDIDDLPSFSPLICYEIIFPNKAVSHDHPRPDYILTVTNDGWYGDSAGPYQHFAQARFRAIEQGIPVVRAANTGVSGVINSVGNIVDKQDLLTQGTVISSLPLALKNPTSYSRYGELWFWGLFSIFIASAFVLRHKSQL